jgi:hypothetical protein
MVSTGLSPLEVQELRDTVLTMQDKQASETIAQLASRELELLETELGKDPEMRAVTLWNVAALCAAAERLDPDSKELDNLIKTQVPHHGS